VFDARPLIRAKRDRNPHAPGEIAEFVRAYAAGEVPDYQASAWLMAAFLNGLDAGETRALTLALLESGRRFDWSDLGRPSADKHSTGGVGDKISLILAPLVAECGVLVPMVSGRGLGHTGGTLDKLESIPGFRTRLSPEAMREQLGRLGVVMVGQGPDIAPADGKLYALRDVTSTVEFEPFIVSSIVSKKVAGGAGAVVYDVKTGDGAFLRDPRRAVGLARMLVEATRALGTGAAALVTDMSQPLGEAVGNGLEVRETIDVLEGRGPADVRALTLELAARMLALAGANPDLEVARGRVTGALDSGRARERFTRLVEAQGGDPRTLERGGAGIPGAPHVVPVRAAGAGRLAEVRTFDLGEVVVKLGGGRIAKEDDIDPRVGLRVLRRIGDEVRAGDVLAEVHAASDDPAVAGRVRECFVVRDEAVEPPALVLERVV
jgi:pyrimidine-nucleoside phosphorylase